MEKDILNINGETVIDHKKRVKWLLSCAEYVMIDYLVKLTINEKKFDPIDCFYKTGLNKHIQGSLIESLKESKFIESDLSVNKDFVKNFLNSENSLESDFLDFWFMEIDIKGNKSKKSVWPGAKPDAFKKYRLARVKESHTRLIEARNCYFEYLAYINNKAVQTGGKQGFMRSKMNASKFLNPVNEHYNEDWKGYLKEEMIKYGDYKDDVEQEILTNEEADKLFK